MRAAIRPKHDAGRDLNTSLRFLRGVTVDTADRIMLESPHDHKHTEVLMKKPQHVYLSRWFETLPTESVETIWRDRRNIAPVRWIAASILKRRHGHVPTMQADPPHGAGPHTGPDLCLDCLAPLPCEAHA